MADEDKIPGTGEKPAPEAPVPETPGPLPDLSRALFRALPIPPAPSDKVINLSDIREGAGGGYGAAVTDKKGPPAPEVTDPPIGPAQEGKTPEKGAAKKQPKRDKTPAPGKGGPTKGSKAPGKGAPSAPAKAGGAKKAPAKPAPEVPPTPRDATRAEKEEIVYLNLSELHPFKDHPFGVRDDTEMQGLVESVKAAGVNQPVLVRPHEDGGYKIIAGHRRQRACELAGFVNMPCIVRSMTDDEAILAMTDDNLRHLEKLLPSEKAAALLQQYEAIKHQGARGDDEAAGKLSLENVGQRNGMSVKTVQRYIWLNDLIPELKETMDGGKLSFTPAVEIPRIRPNLQKYIAVSIEGLGAPTQGQAKRMRELDKKKELKPDVIDAIMGEDKKKEDRNVIITGAELEKYFGPEAPVDDMKGQIMALLDEWKEKQPPELDKAKTEKTVGIEK